MIDKEDKSPRSSHKQATQPARATSQSAIAPGRRTRTMSLLPARSTDVPAPVQQKPNPAAAAVRKNQAELTARWLDTAIRPDLYPPPVQRKGMGTGARDASPQPVNGSGRPMPENVQAKMENAFGVDFSAVRIHEGSQAKAMGALAYTQGSDIHFAPGQYTPDSQRGQELLGHELTHVVQQSQGRVRATTQAKGFGVNDDAGLEREADEMGARAARGERVGRTTDADASVQRSAPADNIQLAVDTNGGEWDTASYTATNNGAGVGKGVGAHIELSFTPKDPVIADTIGLTQTVKTLRNTAAGGAVDQTSFPAGNKSTFALDGTSPGEGDKGRAIDQGDGANPNTSPLYAVEDPPGTDSATLTDVPDDARFGQHGHRKSRGNGTFDVKEAKLNDTPNRSLAFAGQEWTQSFEVAALVLDGPLANTYLGTVAWGWKVDAAGLCTLDPNPITMVSPGAPTSDFMAAAEKWNNATLTDSGGGSHNTVDLPLTTVSSGAQAVTAMTTEAIIARIPVVDAEISGLAGTDKTNKEFEKLALETELEKRKVQVAVKVNSTEDWTGADEVYVKLIGANGAVVTTGQKSLNDGDSHTFEIGMESMLPVNGAFTIKVFDGDWPDGDDELVSMVWASPYGVAANRTTEDGANYEVTVQFKA